MKQTLLIVVLLAVFGFAQTTNPSVPIFNPPQLTWSGPLATSPTQCQTPAATAASLCFVQSSTGVAYWLWDGKQWNQLQLASQAAFVKTVNNHAPDSSGNVQLSAFSVTTSTTNTTLP